MKTKRVYKILALIAIALALFLEGNIIQVNASGAPGGGSTTVKIWRNSTLLQSMPMSVQNEINKFDTPEAFYFHPVYGGQKRQHYGDRLFYESKYLGDYFIYTWKSAKNKNTILTNLTELDHSEFLENWQSAYGSGGWKLVNQSYSKNLKLGWTPPNDPSKNNYSGDNKGHMIVQSGPYKGKHYEWRYMGYTYDGTPVVNPYFPADSPSNRKNWDCNFIIKSWEYPHNLMQPSPYAPGRDLDDATRKIWFEEYLFKQFPQYKTRAQKEGYTGKEWEYWDARLMWQVDPVRGCGVLVGWHNTGGKPFYRTVYLTSNEKRNVRLIELAFYDEEGKLIAKATRDENASYAEPVTNYKSTELKRGGTYTVKATLKNMSDYQTVTNPTILEYLIAYDAEVGKKDPWFEIDDIVNSIDTPTTIPAGGKAHFEWEYIVPEDVENKIQFVGNVPYEYYANYDNYDVDDDTLFLIFDIMKEDMEMINQIDLLDQWGNEVDYVMPGQVYNARFYVGKFKGETPVGESGNPKNPFSTINVTVKDGFSSNTFDSVAKDTLYPEQAVPIETGKKIVPKGSYVEVCAIIDEKHNELGQNDILTNDGPVCKKWVSILDFSIKDFEAIPKSIIRPYGQSAGKEDMSFKFKVALQALDGQSRNVKVVLYRGNTKLKEEMMWISPKEVYDVSWTVNNVPLFYGDVPFKVEVNPVPRQYVEINPNLSNPYINNAMTTSVNVKRNELPWNECKTINTYNSWTQEYYVYEWEGHIEEYDCGYWDCDYGWYECEWGHEHYGCIDEYYVERTCERCETDWEDESYPVRSHYESFEITHVYFRSKVTKDTQGGWIDLLDQPNKAGKIKAGYGFELKVVTKYETNRYSNAPQPWSTKCSGKYVSPGYSIVNAPTTITLTMPYEDESGTPVYYNLVGTKSGSWDDRTITYTLPSRKAIGMNDEVEKIYINEGARNGLYPIRIDTDPDFYGSYDKPYTRYLCDRVTVYINIIGGGTDDLNTHIVQ